MGILEERLEATIVYWSYIGIMEKKLETTEYIGVIYGKWRREWKLLSRVYGLGLKLRLLY